MCNTSSPKHNAIFLMGPTAAGKTNLAMELMQQIPSEIISVDSAMVYREMNIGTGKPTLSEQQQAPHYLIDIRDPRDVYSAAEFRSDALKCMQEITARGKIPILVGGTSLYFQALEFGLSPLPSANAAIRALLEKEATAMGWEKMHQRLQNIDPHAAQRIHPNDPQRISRALEVYEITGQPMSSLWAGENREEQTKIQQELQNYSIHKFALVPRDRKGLHDRIGCRFHKMLKLGFVEELKQLRQREDLHINLPSMRAVGYRQIWQYLDGTLNYETMIEKAIAATRQLAKRQLTWLRNSSSYKDKAVNRIPDPVMSTTFPAIPPAPSVANNKITYLEIENSYLDSLRTMVHCVFVNRA